MFDDQARALAILADSRLTDRVYLLGNFAKGVTILKQQIRALNLIWAMVESNRLPGESGSVAIVGGGIAGLTAAAAILRLSDRPNRICLIERQPSLLPLQLGCDTRWVHPNIYEWPAPGSRDPVAGLPFMNWRAGRASDVAAQLLASWDRIAELDESKLILVTSANHVRVAADGHVEYSGNVHAGGLGHSSYKSSGDAARFDTVIVATGYGVEFDAFKTRTPSYWRNEDIAQPHVLPSITQYLISGTGDGAIVDLMRLRLTRFRQDTIIDEMLRIAPDAEDALRPIGILFTGRQITSGGDLYNRIGAGLTALERYRALVDAFRHRLRTDTRATLQVRSGNGIEAAFGPQKSFLNNVLLYLLFKAGGFGVRFGELRSGESELGEFDKVLIRHGIDPHRGLDAVLPASVVEDARSRELHRLPALPAWKPGWWDRAGNVPDPHSWQEYAPYGTTVPADVFCCAVSATVLSLGTDRVTLHRAITRKEPVEARYLQQLARYSGRRSQNEGEPFRMFNARTGVIGLATALGLPLRIIARQGDHGRASFRQAMAVLGVPVSGENADTGHSQGMTTLSEDVEATVAVPLLRMHEDQLSTVGVVFSDSTSRTSFSDEVCERLVRSCRAFVFSVNRLADAKEHPEINAYDVPALSPELDVESIRNACHLLRQILDLVHVVTLGCGTNFEVLVRPLTVVEIAAIEAALDKPACWPRIRRIDGLLHAYLCSRQLLTFRRIPSLDFDISTTTRDFRRK